MDVKQYYNKLVNKFRPNSKSKYATFDEFIKEHLKEVEKEENKEKNYDKKLPYKFMIQTEKRDNNTLSGISCEFFVNLKTEFITVIITDETITNYHFNNSDLQKYGKFSNTGKLLNLEEIKDKNINEKINGQPSGFAQMVMTNAVMRGQYIDPIFFPEYESASYKSFVAIEKTSGKEPAKISFTEFLEEKWPGNHYVWSMLHNIFLTGRAPLLYRIIMQ